MNGASSQHQDAGVAVSAATTAYDSSVERSPGLGQDSAYTGFLLPAVSLTRREIVRFFRQRSRVIGGLATPILFYALMGSGFGDSFRVTNGGTSIDYLRYAFTGTIILIVLFTSIFANISIIEDRREGFLQSALCSPAWRVSIVSGKVVGSTLLAFLQAMVFVLLGWIGGSLIGVSISFAKVLAVMPVILLLSFGLSGLGFVFAWWLNSIQGFHSIMNLVLFPMWLLSGSFFPASSAPGWMRAIMLANPLTYGAAALRRTLDRGSVLTDPNIPGWGTSAVVLLVFAVIVMLVATRVASATAKGS
jgi:ABC-2 type transport system permease protein